MENKHDPVNDPEKAKALKQKIDLVTKQLAATQKDVSDRATKIFAQDPSGLILPGGEQSETAKQLAELRKMEREIIKAVREKTETFFKTTLEHILPKEVTDLLQELGAGYKPSLTLLRDLGIGRQNIQKLGISKLQVFILPTVSGATPTLVSVFETESKDGKMIFTFKMNPAEKGRFILSHPAIRRFLMEAGKTNEKARELQLRLNSYPEENK